jgi:hypothetical protein
VNPPDTEPPAPAAARNAGARGFGEWFWGSRRMNALVEQLGRQTVRARELERRARLAGDRRSNRIP